MPPAYPCAVVPAPPFSVFNAVPLLLPSPPPDPPDNPVMLLDVVLPGPPLPPPIAVMTLAVDATPKLLLLPLVP